MAGGGNGAWWRDRSVGEIGMMVGRRWVKHIRPGIRLLEEQVGAIIFF